MTQVKEVIFNGEPKSVERRAERIKRDEEKLEELIKKAQAEGGNGEESSEEREEEAGKDAGAEDVKDEKPVTKTAEADEDLSAEEKSFKKRYGDLRRHSQQQIDDLKKQLESLKKGETAGDVPADPKAVKEWVDKHPQVAAIVKSLAEEIADKKLEFAKDRFKQLEQEEETLKLSRMEAAVLKDHKDFDKIRNDDKFHDWLEDQPAAIQSAVYDNTDDAKALSRIISLYKVETTGKRPMGSVESRGKSRVNNDSTDKRTWTREEIKKLSVKEYAKYEKEIDEANAEGRIV